MKEDLTREILQRIQEIDGSVKERLQRIENQLAAGQSVFQLSNEGLTSYRKRLMKEDNTAKLVASVSERVRVDKELHYPHRKILAFLIGRYDPTQRQFGEVHFSGLVKRARIGKNMAKEYLGLLERKGYIERRTDGYRKYFRICSNIDQNIFMSSGIQPTKRGVANANLET